MGKRNLNKTESSLFHSFILVFYLFSRREGSFFDAKALGETFCMFGMYSDIYVLLETCHIL